MYFPAGSNSYNIDESIYFRAVIFTKYLLPCLKRSNKLLNAVLSISPLATSH